MIFIAESGSTKCDAVFLEDSGKEICRFQMMGFNPYFHEVAFIRKKLEQVFEIKKYGPQCTHVFFYGAGCSSPSLNQIIHEGLKSAFPVANIHVDHDLKACAYATYTGEPAISCILGTGSNSVFFDGKDISEKVPALAFILGDEGSASDIGKKLVVSYLYKKMPEAAREDFYKTYGLDKDAIVDKVYAKPNANVFLASLAPFAKKHIEDPFFSDLVKEGFVKFLKIHVQCFPESKHVPVHFVGSIAYHFRDVLVCAMEELNLKMGKLIQKPVDGLLEYHIKHSAELVHPLKKSS